MITTKTGRNSLKQNSRASYFSPGILDGLMEGFQVIGPDWKYLYVNESVCRQAGCSREELLGFTMMEKFPGIEETEVFQRLKNCMISRQPDRMENEFNFPDGRKGWFELRINPVDEGVFVLSIDITELKQIQESQKQVNELLEEMVLHRTAELESKNKDLTDSLVYASRIQSAKLPESREINSAFRECFILHRPKDIVSGDFYFFSRKSDSVFLAAADCTGHGVPGALMTMLCSEKLSDAIHAHSEVDGMLSGLNRMVKSSLRQNGEPNSSWDGMDIALCGLNLHDLRLTYSGANRPFWYLPAGSRQIVEIKPTKQSIGGFSGYDQIYSRHDLQLSPGDVFYLFSDGFPDAFGGIYGKKLTTRRFRQILQEISSMQMQDQEKYLSEFIDTWKGDADQVDDILVMGVRV